MVVRAVTITAGAAVVGALVSKAIVSISGTAIASTALASTALGTAAIASAAGAGAREGKVALYVGLLTLSAGVVQVRTGALASTELASTEAVLASTAAGAGTALQVGAMGVAAEGVAAIAGGVVRALLEAQLEARAGFIIKRTAGAAIAAIAVGAAILQEAEKAAGDFGAIGALLREEVGAEIVIARVASIAAPAAAIAGGVAAIAGGLVRARGAGPALEAVERAGILAVVLAGSYHKNLYYTAGTVAIYAGAVAVYAGIIQLRVEKVAVAVGAAVGVGVYAGLVAEVAGAAAIGTAAIVGGGTAIASGRAVTRAVEREPVAIAVYAAVGVASRLFCSIGARGALV